MSTCHGKATLISSIYLNKIKPSIIVSLGWMKKNVEQHLGWAVIFVNYPEYD